MAPLWVLLLVCGGILVVLLVRMRDVAVGWMFFYTYKTVVVTGASGGIGEGMALRLAPLSCNLVLTARRETELERVASACRARGAVGVHAIRADVTLPEDCKRVVEEAVQRFHRLDVLILNAGVSMSALFSTVNDLSVFRQLMNTNYFGCVDLIHFALPHLQEQRGHIGLVGSQAALANPPYRSGYAASKAAITAFCDVLRLEQGLEAPTRRVTITNCFPGFVDTNIRKHALIGKEDASTSLDPTHMMHVDECAEITLRAIAQGKRSEMYTWSGVGISIVKMLLPALLDRIVRQKLQNNKKKR